MSIPQLPNFEESLILAKILNKPRSFVLAHPHYPLTKAQKAKFKAYQKKLDNGYPLAYLLGEKEFYGLNFMVNQNTLIPRPETEIMIETIIKNEKYLINNQKNIIVDIGTGSGAIIITLAHILINKIKTNPSLYQSTKYIFLATDINSKVLNLAKKNAQLHKLNKKIKFFQGNLIEPIIKNQKIITNKKNYQLIIVANLPYLKPKQFKNSPTIQYEPKSALIGGSDGLKYYRQLIKQISKLNKIKSILIFCEIDPRQVKDLKKIIKQKIINPKIKIIKDYNGQQRIIQILINQLNKKHSN